MKKKLERNENNTDVSWIKTIRKIREYSEEQFDKLIVYLNSGALIITVGFAKDIVKITTETETFFLKISWMLFAVSLLLILISHRTAIISMNYELKQNEKISNQWNKSTQIFNWASMFALILGIVSFLIFVSKEL